MCGRVNITDNEGIRLLLSMLGLALDGKSDTWQDLNRFNVAPTARVQCLVSTPPEKTAALELRHCHWGLVPVWARPGQFKSPLINARSETVHEKPSFRNLIKHQRLLLPVTGFYEWRRDKSNKTPFYIYPTDEQPMLLAGVFQVSRKRTDATDRRDPIEAETATVETTDFALLTTAANDEMARVHDRMPVIISPDKAGAWLLDDDRDNLDELMQPAGNDYLSFRQVSPYVNNARNDGPACVELVDLFD